MMEASAACVRGTRQGRRSSTSRRCRERRDACAQGQGSCALLQLPALCAHRSRPCLACAGAQGHLQAPGPSVRREADEPGEPELRPCKRAVWVGGCTALHVASQISCKQQHNRQLHSLGRLELCERESRGSAGQRAHAPAASELLASPHASLHRMRSSMRRRP